MLGHSFPTRRSSDLPLNDDEIADRIVLRDNASPLRIAFIGAATKNKGFDNFLDLARDADPAAVDFRFIGSLHEAFPGASLAGIDMPSHPLTREDFIRRLREVDYVFMPFTEKTYEFTASGSLLDCVAQMKPVISLNFAGVRELAAKWGDIGFIRQSMAEIRELLSRPAKLSDPELYGGFQDNLTTIGASRTPAGIASAIRRDLMHPATGRSVLCDGSPVFRGPTATGTGDSPPVRRNNE